MISPLSIPPDLLRDRLVPFLDLKSCARLDSAVLCTSLRSNWLDSLTVALLQDRHGSVETDGLSWIAKKKLRLVQVELSGDVSDSDMIVWGKEALSELRTICVNSCQNLTEEGLTHILQNRTKLHKLEIKYCHSIFRLELHDVRRDVLKELHFVGCTTLDDATFTGLVVHFFNLEIVKIAGCEELTDLSVHLLSSNCTKLREIQFRIENEITMYSVSLLAQHCTTLRKIVDTYVFDAVTNTHADPTGRYDDILVELAQKCPLLEHVEVQAPNMTNEQLVTFSQHCPNLHTFNIGLNEIIHEEGVERLLENCPLLRRINLVNLYAFSDVEAIHMDKYCKSLKALHFTEDMNLSESLLYNIWSANTGLETLKLESCTCTGSTLSLDVTHLNTAMLTHLNLTETNVTRDSLLILFARCPVLSTLNMDFTNNASSAAVMTCLGRDCPLLHTLSLAQCHAVHSFLLPDLTALAVLCNSLTDLTLYESNATEEGLTAIMAQNTNLQYLDLRACRNWTDATMDTLTKSCTNLHTLLLTDAKVTDTALCNLVQTCRTLRNVTLSECSFVSMEGIMLLAQHNRRLEHLCVTHSEHVRDTIFCILRQHCPYLRRIELYDCVNVSGVDTQDMVDQYKEQLEIVVFSHHNAKKYFLWPH